MNPEVDPEFLLAFRDCLETLDKLKTLDYADIPGSMIKISEVVDELAKDSVDVDPSERTEYQKGKPSSSTDLFTSSKLLHHVSRKETSCHIYWR